MKWSAQTGLMKPLGQIYSVVVIFHAAMRKMLRSVEIWVNPEEMSGGEIHHAVEIAWPGTQSGGVKAISTTDTWREHAELNRVGRTRRNKRLRHGPIGRR